MKYYCLFSLLSISYQFGCFHDKKTYEVNIKIYLDQYSREKLSEYVVKEIARDQNTNSKKEDNYYNEKDLKENTIAYQNPYVEHYFAAIFNKVNRSLEETNVQVKPDFSEIFSVNVERIYAKHCRDFQNIQDITEGFLQDIRNENENKIFISYCHDEKEYLPQRSHFAAKNECGKVHGMLFGDPEHMRHIIEAGIFEIFHSKTVPQLQEETVARNADVCRYAEYCHKDFPGNGKFRKEIGFFYYKPLIAAKPASPSQKKEEKPANTKSRTLYSNFLGSRGSHADDKKFHDTRRYSYDYYERIIRNHMAKDHSVLNHEGKLLLKDSPVIEKQQIFDNSGKVIYTGNNLIGSPSENFTPDVDHDLSNHHLNFNQRSFLGHLKNSSDEHKLTHNDHIGSYINREGSHGMKFNDLFHHHGLNPLMHMASSHNPLTFDRHWNETSTENESPLVDPFDRRKKDSLFVDHHDYKNKANDYNFSETNFHNHLLVD